MKDEAEQNEFLDEGDAVVIKNKGKLTKLELFISKLEKHAVSLLSSTPQPPSMQPMFSQSKLPELNLPTVLNDNGPPQKNDIIACLDITLAF